MSNPISASSLVKMGRELAASADYYTCVRGFKELDLRLQRTPGIGHWALGIGHWALGIGHGH